MNKFFNSVLKKNVCFLKLLFKSNYPKNNIKIEILIVLYIYFKYGNYIVLTNEIKQASSWNHEKIIQCGLYGFQQNQKWNGFQQWLKGNENEIDGIKWINFQQWGTIK